MFYDKATNGFNPEIVFFGRIHQDLTPPTEEDIDYIDDLKQRLFYNALGEKVGDYLATILARGLMGDKMKNFLAALGPSNSGKTTLTTAMNMVAGDYIGAFNAEDLAVNSKMQSNDEAQLMRWVFLLRFKRLICSNVIKDPKTTKLDGSMI